MLDAIRVLLSGESYWKVRLSSGKVLSELDEKAVPLQAQKDILMPDGNILHPAGAKTETLMRQRGHIGSLTKQPQIRIRRLEWLEDLIASGDIRNVKEVILCTPKGNAHIPVVEPNTVFQFARGTMAIDPAQGKTIRIKNAQMIGVMKDKDTGECACAVWDVQTQQLYTEDNNVKFFKRWRDGVADIGPLNLEVMNVRLD